MVRKSIIIIALVLSTFLLAFALFWYVSPNVVIQRLNLYQGEEHIEEFLSSKKMITRIELARLIDTREFFLESIEEKLYTITTHVLTDLSDSDLFELWLMLYNDRYIYYPWDRIPFMRSDEPLEFEYFFSLNDFLNEWENLRAQ